MTPRQVIKNLFDQQQDLLATNSLTDLTLSALADAGYVIVPRDPSDDAIAKADAALRALPVSQRIVEGPERLRTLRHAWRLIIEAV